MIDLDAIDFVGADLVRPECVLAHASGRLFAADWSDTGGVSVVEPDGRVRRVLARDAATPLRPNGIALLPGGAFLLAHLGDDVGGVWRLEPDGSTAPVLVELDGAPLPPTNFVLPDGDDRLWVTVSTRLQPRNLGYRPDASDGFIVLVDRRGARIVADGLGYTNECRIHPSGDRLFVNETFARRLTAFDIASDGGLSNRTTVAEFGAGTYPDGLDFDTDGGAWITSVVSNRVIRIAPDGTQETLLEDVDRAHLDRVEAVFQAGEMGRPQLDTIAGRRLRSISSLAFGGPDLRTLYLGCLLGDAIARLPAPVAGHPPLHWNCDLGPLAVPRSPDPEETS